MSSQQNVGGDGASGLRHQMKVAEDRREERRRRIAGAVKLQAWLRSSKASIRYTRLRAATVTVQRRHRARALNSAQGDLAGDTPFAAADADAGAITAPSAMGIAGAALSAAPIERFGEADFPADRISPELGRRGSAARVLRVDDLCVGVLAFSPDLRGRTIATPDRRDSLGGRVGGGGGSRHGGAALGTKSGGPASFEERFGARAVAAAAENRPLGGPTFWRGGAIG
ncbi:unnamed protein product, partial [Phaeothamnion confervicola]